MSYSLKDLVVDGVKGELQYATNDIVKTRIDICNVCDYLKIRTCTKCFCMVDLKTKIVKTSCPMGKW